MKKLTLLLLAFALVFASVGCGSDSGNAAGTEDAAQTQAGAEDTAGETAETEDAAAEGQEAEAETEDSA